MSKFGRLFRSQQQLDCLKSRNKKERCTRKFLIGVMVAAGVTTGTKLRTEVCKPLQMRACSIGILPARRRGGRFARGRAARPAARIPTRAVPRQAASARVSMSRTCSGMRAPALSHCDDRDRSVLDAGLLTHKASGSGSRRHFIVHPELGLGPLIGRLCSVFSTAVGGYATAAVDYALGCSRSGRESGCRSK